MPRLRTASPAAAVTLVIAVLMVALSAQPEPAAQAALDTTKTPRPTFTDVPAGTATPAAAATPTAAATLPPTATPAPAAESVAGRPTRIVAPAIGLDAPVVEVGYKIVDLGGLAATSWVVPTNVAGFHTGTARPGQPGNTVISGHHNVGREVFRYLVDLKIGDEIILYVGQVEHHYRVAQNEIVLEKGVSDEQRRENARWIAPTDDERLTLVTCWPYTGNSHRVIVVAFPIR